MNATLTAEAIQGPTIRRSDELARVQVVAEAAGIRMTPGRLAAAAHRLRWVRRYLDDAERQFARIRRWYAESPCRRRGRCPGMPTRARFWRRHRAALGVNEDTFRGWVSRYQQLGAAGLIDQRGAHGERLPVDPRLWGKVLAGLARGEPVAAIHRELTPEARRLGATWPGLRALQIKVRAARAVVARNAHLFTGISGN